MRTAVQIVPSCARVEARTPARIGQVPRPADHARENFPTPGGPSSCRRSIAIIGDDPRQPFIERDARPPSRPGEGARAPRTSRGLRSRAGGRLAKERSSCHRLHVISPECRSSLVLTEGHDPAGDLIPSMPAGRAFATVRPSLDLAWPGRTFIIRRSSR